MNLVIDQFDESNVFVLLKMAEKCNYLKLRTACICFSSCLHAHSNYVNKNIIRRVDNTLVSCDSAELVFRKTKQFGHVYHQLRIFELLNEIHELYGQMYAIRHRLGI